ncbi:hypothetical protein B0H11DRAFT_2217894 [Mycena galericulata]|nr:hypothetical protein B0H11DRAFT_2217894 [Mycena galericulata]
MLDRTRENYPLRFGGSTLMEAGPLEEGSKSAQAERQAIWAAGMRQLNAHHFETAAAYLEGKRTVLRELHSSLEGTLQAIESLNGMLRSGTRTDDESIAILQKDVDQTTVEIEDLTKAIEVGLQNVHQRGEMILRHVEPEPPRASKASTSRQLDVHARQSAMALPPMTPAVEQALEHLAGDEVSDHFAFMDALSLDKTAFAWVAHGPAVIRKRIKEKIHRSIFAPAAAAHADEVRRGLMDIIRQEPTNTQKRIRGEAPPDVMLDSQHRAECLWEKRTNAWQPGASVVPLLQPTEFTNSDHSAIREAAHTILTKPRLLAILHQQFGGMPSGAPVSITGIDGHNYIVDQLVQHPKYGSLLRDDHLWQTLHGPEMQRLVGQSASNAPFAGFTEPQLEKLAMALRIASVVIHYAVRDSIKYGFGQWGKTAADVLRLRNGSCSSSANLAAALGRAAGVPSGSVVTWVEVPHYFSMTVGPNLLPCKERVSVHHHVGWVTLDKDKSRFTWRDVESDPSDPFELGIAIVHMNFPATRVVDFDGTTTSLLNFPRDFVYDRAGPLARVDPLLRKEPRLFPSARDRIMFIKHLVGSLVPSPIQVEQFALLFANEQEKHVIAPLADAHCLYGGATRAYCDAVLNICFRLDIQKAFPEKLAFLLHSFLMTRPVLCAVSSETSADVSDALAEGYIAMAGERGVTDAHMPACETIAQHLSAIVEALRPLVQCLPRELRNNFATGFAVASRFNVVLSLGDTPEVRQATWQRTMCSTYEFMAECYPTDVTRAFGPKSAPRWMPTQQQQDYLRWLTQHASPKAIDNSNQCALAFVLGPQAQRFRGSDGLITGDISKVCWEANLNEADVYRCADFHEHLLSGPAAAVMNLAPQFVTENAESIRRAADVVPEFEKWLDGRYPVLSRLHREELKYTPQYPYSVYLFLMRRMMMDMPPASRQALAEFVRHKESAGAPVPANEAALDADFMAFLKVRGIPSESFFKIVPGGTAKPYGMLYDLWKSNFLPLEQGNDIGVRLIKTETAHLPAPDVDWFFNVAPART